MPLFGPTAPAAGEWHVYAGISLALRPRTTCTEGALKSGTSHCSRQLNTSCPHECWSCFRLSSPSKILYLPLLCYKFVNAQHRRPRQTATFAWMHINIHRTRLKSMQSTLMVNGMDCVFIVSLKSYIAIVAQLTNRITRPYTASINYSLNHRHPRVVATVLALQPCYNA